MVIDFY